MTGLQPVGLRWAQSLCNAGQLVPIPSGQLSQTMFDCRRDCACSPASNICIVCKDLAAVEFTGLLVRCMAMMIQLKPPLLGCLRR